MKFTSIVALIGAASANLQVNIDDKSQLKVAKAYFKYLASMEQNPNVVAFESGLEDATEKAAA
jgi:hypothetical protein